MSEAVTLDTPSREQALSLAENVLTRITTAVSQVKALVRIRNRASVEARFARNEMLDVTSKATLMIDLEVDIDGHLSSVGTDRADPQGLTALVAEAENLARQNHGGGDGMSLRPPNTFTDPPLYFAGTVRAGVPEVQGDIARDIAQLAERASLVGTGNLSFAASTVTVMNTAGFSGHTRRTYGEIAVNARTVDAKGSGWAWGGHEDFSRIDPLAVAARAIDIAQRSAKPRAVEPGRYTVILEPEALAQLIQEPVMRKGTESLSSGAAGAGRSVFSKFEGRKRAGTKLGLQMADRRVQLYSDPADPDMPFSPLGLHAQVISRTPWIENGILKNLDTWETPCPGVARLQIDGPTQTLEEMIAGTRRGIWVHRFSDPMVMNPLTLLLTGVTRDGTFLIENGKVTRAIKNLRFSESPFFILNKIEAFGPTVRASSGLACPRIKVRDFEFTALSDAI